MTWTPEQTAARAAERERYTAEHPKISDPALRTLARATKRGAERGEKFRRYLQWWADLPPLQKAVRRKRKSGRGGRPMRRARMEVLRQAEFHAGRPVPSQSTLREILRTRERDERAAYRERRAAE